MNNSDERVLKYQLKRELKHTVKSIVKRCIYGNPVVIESDVISGKCITTTLYYLTCPVLTKAVSRLEKAGFSIEVFKSLKSAGEENFLINAHIEYASRRWETVKDRVDDSFTGEQINVLKNAGISGNSDYLHIKCLHSHVASYLAGINDPVGIRVYQSLKEEVC